MKRLHKAVKQRRMGGKPLPTVLQGLPPIRRSEVTMIAGQPGAGKSLIALWHALGWVEGGMRGIYFSADSAELGQASRALAMSSVNVSVREAEQLIEEEDPWAIDQLSKLEGLAWSFEDDLSYENIDAEVMAHLELWGEYPQFIIIDNLTDVEGQSEDEGGTQRRAMKALVQLARKTDAALVVLHHTSENERIKEDPCPPRNAIMFKVSAKPAMVWTVADKGLRRPVAVVKDRFGKSDKSGNTAAWFWLDDETLHWRK